MLLVDTNIVAYLLIDGNYTAEARELYERDHDWRSEAFVMVEFTNVLASSIATRRMNSSLAHDFLTGAASIFENKLIRVPHRTALDVALKYRVTAYDARFLALADQFGQRLITEDAKLRAAAPKLTLSLREALSVSSS